MFLESLEVSSLLSSRSSRSREEERNEEAEVGSVKTDSVCSEEYSLHSTSTLTSTAAAPSPAAAGDEGNLWKSLVSLERRITPSTLRNILLNRNQQFGITRNFASKSTSPQSSRSSYCIRYNANRYSLQRVSKVLLT